MPKEQSFQTLAQQKEMYLKSVRPPEMLYKQPFPAVKQTMDPLMNSERILKLKGQGGSI